MTITLTPAVEKTSQRHARKLGTTPELLALQVLQERLSEPEGGGRSLCSRACWNAIRFSWQTPRHSFEP